LLFPSSPGASFRVNNSGWLFSGPAFCRCTYTDHAVRLAFSGADVGSSILDAVPITEEVLRATDLVAPLARTETASGEAPLTSAPITPDLPLESGVARGASRPFRQPADAADAERARRDH
jgi:hypothetical protein